MKNFSDSSLDWGENISKAGDSVIQHIFDTPIQQDPCLHMVVDNVFPQDIYAEIQQRWPSMELFERLGDTGRLTVKNSYKARHILMTTRENIEALKGKVPEKDYDFWLAMADWLNSKSFTHALLNKCGDYLRQKYGDEVNEYVFFPRSQLVVDDGEYSLGPHTDAPSRAIVMLFYMPPDESAREHGTSLYQPKDKDFRCKGGPHYQHKDFDLVKTVDFIPNRLFMFIKNDVSWHGVEPIYCDGNKRRVLSVKIHAVKQSEIGK